MGMFTTREPRRFDRPHIYYDERKEKLKKMEEKAKRELGLLPEDPAKEQEERRERIHEAIVGGTKHLKRREERGGSGLSYQALVVGILVLLFILKYLLSGYTIRLPF